MTVKAVRIRAHVARVVPLGQGLGRVDCDAPNLAAGVVAGRLAMVEAVGRPDCVLLRPFSYFGKEGTDRVSFLLRVVGAGTGSLLTARPGDEVTIMGPLGSTYPDFDPKHGTCWCVAGGVGAAPFGLLGHKPNMRVLFGARSVAEAGFAEALKSQGCQVDLATDDGSSGFAGNVVELLRAKLASSQRPDRIFTCGPSVMMQAVVRVARGHQVPTWASLEERMGCGIGICRGCAHLDASGGWRCICVDGPVYDAKEIYP